METLDVAINGTKLMLELAKKNAIYFFRSSEIYGDPDQSEYQFRKVIEVT